MGSLRLRREVSWVGVAFVMAVVYATSVYGYPLARVANRAGFGWYVRWGVPVLLAVLAWQAPRIYEWLGAPWAVAKPWLVVGLGAQALVIFLGDSDIERYHVVTFGLLGFALVWALVPSFGFVHGGLLVLLLGTALGLSDEVLQGFLPDRVYDPHDVVKDALAAAASLAFACPFAPRLGAVPRRIDRSVAGAAALLGAAIVLCVGLGTRPSVPRTKLVGSWDAVTECGVAETFELRRDGSTHWHDAEGNEADGVWSVESTAFEAILKIQPKHVRNARPNCGLHADRRWVAKVELEGPKLVIPQFNTNWTRAPEPPKSPSARP